MENEYCDSNDGLCKCGLGDSCENKPWSPTCNALSESCSCGSHPPCNEENEKCDEASSQCIENQGPILMTI